MYQILIAEDEPPITRYLTKIIQTKCTDFHVAATAENGEEALEKIRAQPIDIVLTDAKMPFMDGIELIARLKAEFPDILTVVISGYQDFQYVKRAFKSGAQDYLLKPVQPSQLNELLRALAVRLDNRHYKEKQEQLENLLFDRPFTAGRPDSAELAETSELYVCILRKNGLPSRYFTRPFFTEIYLFSHFDRQTFQEFFQTDEIWLLGGRDENETIVVSVFQPSGEPDFSRVFSQVIEKLGAPHSFMTMAYSREPAVLENLKEKTVRLYRFLDQLITTGKNKITCIDFQSPHPVEPPVPDSALLNKLEYYISNRMMDPLKQQLVKLFSQWEEEERPQVWVEQMVRALFHIISKNLLLSADDNTEIERMLDETLFYSTTFGELLAGIWDIVNEFVQNRKYGHAPNKGNADDLLGGIDQFIRKNLADQFSLQNVCDEFGVSQTYLSRLFRRHKGTSFNEYVTTLRIQEAKKIMSENRDILLKDVAAIVGYKDPYYFSRVFKSVTGCPPSAFNNS